MAKWRSVLGCTAGLFLGLVLVVATVAKAVEPGAFAEQIRLEGLDFLLPVSWVVLLALALEAGLGVLLLFGLRRLWVLLPAAGLVAFFVFLTGRNYWLVAQGKRSPDAACGCFGSLLERTPSEAFWQDLLLLVPALMLAFFGRAVVSYSVPWVRLGIATLAVGLVVSYAGTRPDLYFSAVAADIAEEAALEGEHYTRTRDYQLIRGEEVVPADIYYSAQAVAFLVLSPVLSNPVLLEVRTESVWTFGADQITSSDQENLTLSPDLVFLNEGVFSVDPQGISFWVEGLRFNLRNAEETAGVLNSYPAGAIRASKAKFIDPL